MTVGAELARSGALVRTVAWQPALGGGLIAVAVAVWQAGEVADPDAVATLLRATVLLLVFGSLFGLDDPVASLTEAVPVRASYRLGLRLLIALGPAGIGFAAVAAVVRTGSTEASMTLIGGVALEWLATMLFGLAVAALAARYWAVAEPSLVAVPSVIGLWLGLSMLPNDWAMLVEPGRYWGEAHGHWAVLLGVSAAAIAIAARDPATPPYYRGLAYYRCLITAGEPPGQFVGPTTSGSTKPDR